MSAASFASLTRQVSTGSNDTDLGWDPLILLELSNVVRAILRITQIPDRNKVPLEQLLEVMLGDENSRQPIELRIISTSRFDKLLEDLIEYNIQDQTDDLRVAAIVSKASSLQLKWQQRFKAAYFSIDEDRLKFLKAEGALHDVILNDGYRVFPHIWHVVRMTRLEDGELKVGM